MPRQDPEKVTKTPLFRKTALDSFPSLEKESEFYKKLPQFMRRETFVMIGNKINHPMSRYLCKNAYNYPEYDSSGDLRFTPTAQAAYWTRIPVKVEVTALRDQNLIPTPLGRRFYAKVAPKFTHDGKLKQPFHTDRPGYDPYAILMEFCNPVKRGLDRESLRLSIALEAAIAKHCSAKGIKSPTSLNNMISLLYIIRDELPINVHLPDAPPSCRGLNTLREWISEWVPFSPSLVSVKSTNGSMADGIDQMMSQDQYEKLVERVNDDLTSYAEALDRIVECYKGYSRHWSVHTKYTLRYMSLVNNEEIQLLFNDPTQSHRVRTMIIIYTMCYFPAMRDAIADSWKLGTHYAKDVISNWKKVMRRFEASPLETYLVFFNMWDEYHSINRLLSKITLTEPIFHEILFTLLLPRVFESARGNIELSLLYSQHDFMIAPLFDRNRIINAAEGLVIPKFEEMNEAIANLAKTDLLYCPYLENDYCKVRASKYHDLPLHSHEYVMDYYGVGQVRMAALEGLTAEEIHEKFCKPFAEKYTEKIQRWNKAMDDRKKYWQDMGARAEEKAAPRLRYKAAEEEERRGAH